MALDHLRRIVQALRESSRASERQLGVSGAQLFVLQTLAKNRALSLNGLAERTHTHQSTVSVVVNSPAHRVLTRRDLVEGGELDRPIRELLRRAPVVVSEHASLREAVDRRASERIGRLPIVSSSSPRRLLGIITRGDYRRRSRPSRRRPRAQTSPAPTRLPARLAPVTAA